MPVGYPLNIKREALAEAINETGGNVLQTAKKLGISYHSVYKLVNSDEEMLALLDNARKMCVERLLDQSINTFELTMDDMANNPRLAADIAKFIVEKRGHTRYLGTGKEGDEENVKAIDQYTGLMTQLTIMQKRARNDRNTDSSGPVQPEAT